MEQTRTTTTTIPFTGPRRSLREERPESSNPLTRLFSRRHSEQNSLRLEEVIDLDRDVNLFSQQEAQLLRPEILYRQGRFFKHTGLFRAYQEIEISVVDGSIAIIDVLSEEGNLALKKKNYRLIHQGMYVIGVKGLIRKGSGTKAILVLYDSRFQNNMRKATIALIEIDLNNNIGIFYCAPDFMMVREEFAKYIKLGVQVRGFESMIGGHNLLICLGFLGKCMNNSSVNYRINTGPVLDLMGSKGIRMLKPITFKSEDLAGLEWNLDKFTEKTTNTIVPSENYMYQDINGQTIARFGQYIKKTQEEKDSEGCK